MKIHEIEYHGNVVAGISVGIWTLSGIEGRYFVLQRYERIVPPRKGYRLFERDIIDSAEMRIPNPAYLPMAGPTGYLP